MDLEAIHSTLDEEEGDVFVNPFAVHKNTFGYLLCDHETNEKHKHCVLIIMK
jgi:hypothetical protein